MEKNKFFISAQIPESSSQTINSMNIQYGWVCPKCGRVYGPVVGMCYYCGGTDHNFATTTTTIPKTDYYPLKGDNYNPLTGTTSDLDCAISQYERREG